MFATQSLLYFMHAAVFTSTTCKKMKTEERLLLKSSSWAALNKWTSMKHRHPKTQCMDAPLEPIMQQNQVPVDTPTRKWKQTCLVLEREKEEEMNNASISHLCFPCYSCLDTKECSQTTIHSSVVSITKGFGCLGCNLFIDRMEPTLKRFNWFVVLLTISCMFLADCFYPPTTKPTNTFV